MKKIEKYASFVRHESISTGDSVKKADLTDDHTIIDLMEELLSKIQVDIPAPCVPRKRP